MIHFDNATFTYAFASNPSIRDLSLRVRPGEVMLLTGPSGCGKSTVVRLANGLALHHHKGSLSGQVSINGVENSNRPIGEIARDIGTLFQDPESQFFALKVSDELAMPHEWQAIPKDEIHKKIKQSAELFGIADILSSSTLTLSEGQKQKVALASIMSMKPKALILDEPTANLDPESAETLAKIILRLKEQGTAILIVDHRLYWLRHVVDKVAVMQQGKIVAKGAYSILEDCALQKKYGLRKSTVHDMRHQLPEIPSLSQSCISIKDVCFGYKSREIFNDISLDLPAGKTVGIIGPNGVGKTTFALMLTGLLKASKGSFFLHGKSIKPSQLLVNTSIILQNTDHQLHMQNAAQEIASAAHCIGGLSDEAVKELLASYNIQDLSHRHPQSLSGGEKQRLVIACGEAKQPSIVILDEPTSGLDGTNMQLIAESIKRFTKQGACVLLISHDLELLEAACDYRLTLPFLPTKTNGATHDTK